MRQHLVSVAVGFLLILAATLTGCGAERPGPHLTDHYPQDLGNGTSVDCWYINRGNDKANSVTGGPTCDWVGYHQRYDKSGR